MEDLSLADENWGMLQSLFPKDWKKLAKDTGAITRKLRTFTSEEAVMQTLLIHITKGYSLRETVVRAKLAKIADVSDVALLKRLRQSEAWLKALCESLLKERGIKYLPKRGKIQMRLVDGTNVKEPGKTGSLWRIHYSLNLPDLKCDYFKLTSNKGKGSGETFKQYPVSKNDCIIGDRGYSTSQGIAYIHKHKAYAIVRVNTASIKFCTQDGEAINLLSKVKGLETAGGINEWTAYVKGEDNKLIQGRLCIIRKSETAIELAIKQLKREASKRQSKLRPETREFAKYIIVFTTLPSDLFTSAEILEWYRLRWQIELIFKRLKSLAGLGHLPKHDEASSRAWLYGKLFAGLLTEKLIAHASNISPWGYCMQTQEDKKQLA